MRVELWRCSVKEAKSSGETTCALASAAILEKSRNKDSLMAEEDTERRSTDFKGKWGRIGMAGAWPGDPAIIQTVCCYVDLQAARAADTRVLRKKVMYFVEADCSGTSLIDLVTITIPGSTKSGSRRSLCGAEDVQGTNPSTHVAAIVRLDRKTPII